jgi:large subunit ribosomal protein L30
MAVKEGTIKIQLIGSPICCPEKHKVIVRSLGLKKMNRIVVRPDNAAFRGMVLKIPHLLAIVVEPKPAGLSAAKPGASKPGVTEPRPSGSRSKKS